MINSDIPSGQFVPKPLRETTPSDFGGINARTGFAYQDHIAAKFVIEMLSSDMLKEVWCETYDDIVLVWAQGDKIEQMEFVQVKNENLDQLYTPAILTKQKDSKKGTSLLEHSLSRDNCAEAVRFRIVSSLGVIRDLMPLTFSRDDGSRSTQKTAITELQQLLSLKPAGAYVSLNGNGVRFWIDGTFWDVQPFEAVVPQNKLSLRSFLEKQGLPVDSEALDDLYDKLLSKVKSAAEANFLKNRSAKILIKPDLDAWVKKESTPQFAGANETKLRAKLQDTGLSEECIEGAMELRRDFAKKYRDRGYQSAEDMDFIVSNVRGILYPMRLELDSGMVVEDGVPFHQLCVEKLNADKAEYAKCSKPPDRGFLLGCMYDITSRCRHRFKRAKA